MINTPQSHIIFSALPSFQVPAHPTLTCPVENPRPAVSYYSRPQVTSYNTYHSTPHLPPYSAYDFQVRLGNLGLSSAETLFVQIVLDLQSCMVPPPLSLSCSPCSIPASLQRPAHLACRRIHSHCCPRRAWSGPQLVLHLVTPHHIFHLLKSRRLIRREN